MEINERTSSRNDLMDSTSLLSSSFALAPLYFKPFMSFGNSPSTSQVLSLHSLHSLTLLTNTMKIAAALSVAIAATVASTASAQSTISEVPVGTAQYVASARSTADGKNLCSGSLIHPKWILTTTLCMNDIEWVNVGTHFQSGATDGTTVKILRKVKHPRFYAAGSGFDFLLLELEKEVPYTPVQLAAADSSEEPVGVSATTRGWGGSTQNFDGSKVLRQLDVNVISNEDCKTKLSLVPDSMICTAAKLDNESCQGGAGDPLVVNKNGTPVQVGVMSWAHGCWQNPAVYARVSAGRSFIDQYVKQVRWV